MENYKNPVEIKQENIFAGIVGALLFAIIGGAVYFGIYQLGYIAGICGFIMFMLSNFGYSLFSGVKNSMKGIITAIIMTVVMLFVSEYICLAFDIYKAFGQEGIEVSFAEALNYIPDFMQVSEVRAGVIKDLLFAYALGALATFGSVKQAIAKNKEAQKTIDNQYTPQFEEVSQEQTEETVE